MKIPLDDVADIFDATIALPPEQRAAHLERACHGNERLAQRVKTLLDAHDRVDQVLLEPPSTSGSSLGQALDAGSPRDVAGTRIGHYTLGRVIAVGGMGVVYEAQQDNPRRSVAIKVMNAGMATKSAVRRFEFETQVLGRLQHPNIARIHDAGVHDADLGPVPYFAMELIDNANTIVDYAEENSLESTARLQLFVRVCRAVHHGHLKGVIHRDLKPSNILVDASGEPKIIDFGVARATDSDASLTTGRTHYGNVIGTVQYMSPEQAGGRMDELDTRSDVYSLGVLLFELLSGALPYALGDLAILDAVRIIQQDEPATLGSISATLRGDIETIVAKAIEKEPARRYQSADELAADIRRYLRNEPIEARPATTRYQLAKFARRNRVGVAATAVIALVLVVSTVVSIGFALSEADQRRLAEQREVEADEARAEEQAQREQLARVADFQANMFSGIRPRVMGEGVFRMMASSIRERFALEGRSQADIDAMLASLEQIERRVNATDLARSILAENILDPSVAAISRDLGEESDVAIYLQFRIGSIYRNLGLLKEARPLLENACAFAQGVSNVFPVHINMQLEFALFLNDLGSYDESHALLTSLATTLSTNLGPEHHKTLRTRMLMANQLLNLDRDDEALDVYTDILEISQRVMPDDSCTYDMMHNLAVVYGKRNRDEEAFSLFHKVADFQARRNDIDPASRLLDHGRRDDLGKYVGTLFNIGINLIALDRLDEATPILEEVLDWRSKNLGDDHPQTLSSLSLLADYHTENGRKDLAIQYRARILAVRVKALGTNHPEVLDALDRFAWSSWKYGDDLYDEGRHEEAFATYRAAFDACQDALAEPGFPPGTRGHVGYALDRLAERQRDPGALDDLRQVLDVCLAADRQFLARSPNDDLRRADYMNTLDTRARLERRVGDASRARELDRMLGAQLEKFRDAILSDAEGHDQMSTLLSGLHVRARDAGEFEFARRLMEQLATLDQRRNEHDPVANVEVLEDFGHLAWICRRLGDEAAARAASDTVASLVERFLAVTLNSPVERRGYALTLNSSIIYIMTDEPNIGVAPEHMLRLAVYTNELTDHQIPDYLDVLALAHYQAGDLAEAVQWQSRAVELEDDEEMREQRTETLEHYRDLAYRYQAPSLAARIQALGAGHPDRLEAVERLARSSWKRGNELYDEGRTEEAFAAYQAAFDVCQASMAEPGFSLLARDHLGYAIRRLVRRQRDPDATDDHRSMIDACLAADRRFLARTPDDRARRAQYGRTLISGAVVELRSGNPERARELDHLAAAQFHQAYDEIMNDESRHRQFSADYVGLYKRARKAGEWPLTRRLIEQLAMLTKRRNELDPFVAISALRNHGRLARVCRHLGDEDAARRATDTVAALAKRFLAFDPEGPEDRQRYASALNNSMFNLLTETPSVGVDPMHMLRLAAYANELSDHRNAYHLDTLALAHYQAGEFSQAVQWQSRAVELEEEQEIREQMTASLERYRDAALMAGVTPVATSVTPSTPPGSPDID